MGNQKLNNNSWAHVLRSLLYLIHPSIKHQYSILSTYLPTRSSLSYCDVKLLSYSILELLPQKKQRNKGGNMPAPGFEPGVFPLSLNTFIFSCSFSHGWASRFSCIGISNNSYSYPPPADHQYPCLRDQLDSSYERSVVQWMEERMRHHSAMLASLLERYLQTKYIYTPKSISPAKTLHIKKELRVASSRVWTDAFRYHRRHRRQEVTRRRRHRACTDTMRMGSGCAIPLHYTGDYLELNFTGLNTYMAHWKSGYY